MRPLPHAVLEPPHGRLRRLLVASQIPRRSSCLRGAHRACITPNAPVVTSRLLPRQSPSPYCILCLLACCWLPHGRCSLLCLHGSDAQECAWAWACQHLTHSLILSVKPPQDNSYRYSNRCLLICYSGMSLYISGTTDCTTFPDTKLNHICTRTETTASFTCHFPCYPWDHFKHCSCFQLMLIGCWSTGIYHFIYIFHSP
jgi:hypothetical protein